MADASYLDPRLAAAYDTLNPAGKDTAFYLDLAGTTPRSILDMGCGTGLLAVEFARRGHNVTAADPAGAMLAIARERAGGELVTWVESDAAGLSTDGHFDLIVMTGHVFQVFLDDEAVAAALGNLRRLLAPSGRLVFETRNPAVRAWEAWTPENTLRRIDVDGIGVVEVHHDVVSVADQLVGYETHFRFGENDVVVAPSKLRFMERTDLATFLADAGFAEVIWCGDWDRGPASVASPEIIVVAS